MTATQGIRATPRRVAELREEMAEREGRLQQRMDDLEAQLNRRDDFARRLAHNLAVAITATLKGDPAR